MIFQFRMPKGLGGSERPFNRTLLVLAVTPFTHYALSTIYIYVQPQCECNHLHVTHQAELHTAKVKRSRLSQRFLVSSWRDAPQANRLAVRLSPSHVPPRIGTEKTLLYIFLALSGTCCQQGCHVLVCSQSRR